MSLPEPETHGHGAAQGARVALDRDRPDRAIEHLAGGMAWSADMLVVLETRLAALEEWAQQRGYEMPALPDPDDI